MTIGPAPMIRMEWISARLGMECQARGTRLFHHLHESFEQVRHLMRPRARLRVALEAVGGPVRELQSLQRAVEERAVGRAHVRGKRLFVHREAMVLAGDED